MQRVTPAADCLWRARVALRLAQSRRGSLLEKRVRCSACLVLLLVLVGCAGSSTMLSPGARVSDILLSRTTSESLPYSSYCVRSADTPSPLAPGSLYVLM